MSHPHPRWSPRRTKAIVLMTVAQLDASGLGGALRAPLGPVAAAVVPRCALLPAPTPRGTCSAAAGSRQSFPLSRMRHAGALVRRIGWTVLLSKENQNSSGRQH